MFFVLFRLSKTSDIDDLPEELYRLCPKMSRLGERVPRTLPCPWVTCNSPGFCRTDAADG